MPSSLNSGPFLSLRPDHDCGRSKVASPKSFSSLSGTASPATNGNGYSHSSGHGSLNSTVNGNGSSRTSTSHDEFLRLDAPQQDLLLLHGPRQKYKLEKSQDLPTLQGEREILVQVLAIGLNPVDWKGADYGFSQPSYPWVNGRDFAGIVVRAPRIDSRIQQGDVVFGPSTDYRDVRKAAYQEYVVTTDYNVSRIPQGVDVKEGAALGVAWVAAVVSLGISFGVDFSTLRNAPQGPDLVRLVRSLDPREVPDDIRDEIFSGISQSERPQPGEWIAIWGANSMTGQVALQLAKHAGLKVACIADIARGGARLSELGADFLVDKYDDKRAVDILKAVTGGKLRFGFDCNGKESATSLQDALTQSDSGLNSHLLGLNGLPKSVGRGVVHHKVPIKIFHEAPHAGEAISAWLEQLLIAHSLKLPEVEVAQGGLAGINDALDRMRTGTIGGKRIVVAVGSESKEPSSSPTNGILPNGIGAQNTDIASQDFSYADSLNSDPNRVRFAYWVPNVSGGLVISKIKQRTNWDLKSNIRYAKTAERVGFEYALSQIRFMAGYGADNQHEPVTFSQALLMHTERLKLIAALLPGPWNPAVAAKQIASIDNYTDGRVCVNVVSGWFKAEFTSIGQWWLDHAERYRRSKEFIQCLKGIWTEEKFNFKGDFYQFHDYPLKPKPLNLPGRPYPEIFQGGNSDDAKENAGSVSDYYFMNGNTLEGFQSQIADVKERAKKNGREGQVGFALNAFVICRETEEEAFRVLAEIQGKADKEAVEGFRQQVANAGSSTSNKSGMWANSKFEDLVQYNDGFKTKLIGTKEQIAERILLLKSLGVDIILTAFLHYEEEIEGFGREVLPLVRELEGQGRGVDEGDEVRRTGDVYRKLGEEKNSTIESSTAAAAAVSSSKKDGGKRPFASLMPTPTFPIRSSSSHVPHRPFPPTYRNPGGDVSQLSVFQPKPHTSPPAVRNGEGHKPFPPEHRNPVAEGEPRRASATEQRSTAKEPGPHRPFAPEHRNPGAAASPHRSSEEEVHNSETDENKVLQQSLPRSVDTVGESKEKPHRAFEAAYRKPDVVQPHNVPHRNAEMEQAPAKESSDGIRKPLSVDLLGESKETLHRAFNPGHRNIEPESGGSFTLGPKNIEPTALHTRRPQKSASALRTQDGNIDSKANSPAGSEKSFETADGGSSGVDVSLADARTAENGAPEMKSSAQEESAGTNWDTASRSPPGTSGSGKSVEGKKERGLLKGLRNSLRRSRG